MPVAMPINFMQWIEEHRHLLKPPVGNQVVYEDTEFIIMVVGGPNTRTDYHVDPAEEFFYQLEGDMELPIVDKDEQGADVFKTVRIKEGEIFLLPAWVPHSPQRFENTVGLVIERKRRADEIDALQWYCERCKAIVFKKEFHLEDIVKQLPPVFDEFYSSEANRTCEKCGWTHPPRQ